MALTIIFFFTSLHGLLFFITKRWDRLYWALLLFSHVYFCLGGYYYWITVNEGYFVGVEWSISDLKFCLALLSACTFFLAFFTLIFRDGLGTRNKFFAPANTNPILQGKAPPYWSFFFWIGLVSSAIVLLASVSPAAAPLKASFFFLIAYQLSDCLIPAIIYRVADRGINKGTMILILLFCIYAAIVGFRYKIALLAIPLVSMAAYAKISSQLRVIIISSVSLSSIILFSLLTLFRVKFSGLTFEGAAEKTAEDFLYGAFAEANIVFGLNALIAEFPEKGVLIWLTPVFDSIKEWIPRVFYPDRTSGEYLLTIGLGLQSREGARSGTAYPFVGEFLMMFGWIGIVIAIIFYSALYRFSTRYIANHAQNNLIRAGGIGIVVSMICYYNYSRGYFPQVSKAYLCVLVPYFLFIHKRSKKNTQNPSALNYAGKNIQR